MTDSPQLFFAKQEQAEKTRFEKKGEHAFHGQCLPDDAARRFGKLRPVRAELEFHGNSSDHTDRKIDSEDASPELRGAVVVLVARSKRFGLQVDKQEREPHRQLWKNVVEGYGERELQSVDVQRFIHNKPRCASPFHWRISHRMFASAEPGVLQAAFSHFRRNAEHNSETSHRRSFRFFGEEWQFWWALVDDLRTLNPQFPSRLNCVSG